jgi:deoxyribonuclease IV
MKPLLGMHVSAAGGGWRAIANGNEMGAETIQFFGASPRSYVAPLPSEEDAARFRQMRAESNIKAVYLHAPYLVNLSSDKEDLRKKSIKNLAAHLAIAEAYGADGVVFHPGSYGQQLPEQGIAYTAAGMRAVLEQVPGTAKLLIENTAGGGTKLGGIPEEIATMLEQVDLPERTGCCLDTAHAFEAGIIDDYADSELLEAFIKRWEETVGFTRTYAVHANDSKTQAGSHHDQHENIGDGYIGTAGFIALARTRVLNHAAWMLEVPGIEGFGPDKENLDRLRAAFTI